MRLSPAHRARLHALLACLGTLVLWWRFPARFTLSLLAVACLLAVLAWCSPRAYAPVQRTFDTLTHALLITLSWAMLGLVYFGLFTPLRLWRELIRKDPLQRQLRPRPDLATFLQPSAPASPFGRQF